MKRVCCDSSDADDEPMVYGEVVTDRPMKRLVHELPSAEGQRVFTIAVMGECRPPPENDFQPEQRTDIPQIMSFACELLADALGYFAMKNACGNGPPAKIRLVSAGGPWLAHTPALVFACSDTRMLQFDGFTLGTPFVMGHDANLRPKMLSADGELHKEFVGMVNEAHQDFSSQARLPESSLATLMRISRGKVAPGCEMVQLANTSAGTLQLSCKADALVLLRWKREQGEDDGMHRFHELWNLFGERERLVVDVPTHRQLV